MQQQPSIDIRGMRFLTAIINYTIAILQVGRLAAPVNIIGALLRIDQAGQNLS
jgi:hypothetical protein